MRIGDRIRAERLRAGMGQAELSRAAGLLYISVGRYERGSRTPSIATLAKIADALGVDLVDLVAPSEGLFEVEFPAPIPAAVVLAALDGRRVAPWPDLEDGRLRLRCSSHALGSVVALAGQTLLGATVPDPVARPVTPSPTLAVLVGSPGPRRARQEAWSAMDAHLDRRPPLRLRKHAAGWLVLADRIAESSSVALQSLSDCAPFGMFVPAG